MYIFKYLSAEEYLNNNNIKERKKACTLYTSIKSCCSKYPREKKLYYC